MMHDKISSPAASAAQLSPRCCLVVLAFVLLAGVAARTYHLVGLPHDNHWYRQYETAALARNFYEGRMNILYPQVDWGGESPGYVESEFPVYPYLVAVLYQIGGPQEWLARMLNICLYVPSALLLFLLTRKVYDERAALLATAFYSFLPLSYFFTRDIQADALAALGTLAGIYFFWTWTEGERWPLLVLSALGTALAVLIKPSNLYIGLPLLYLLWSRFGPRFLGKWPCWLYALAVLLPAYLWYAHAFTLWENYGNTFFRAYVGMTLPSLTDDIWLTFGNTILQRLVFNMATPAGVLLLALGFLKGPPRGVYLLHWWAVGFGISMVIAPGPHAGHDYYQLPAIYFIAAFMGQGLALILSRQVSSLALAIALSILATVLIVLCVRESPDSSFSRVVLIGGSLVFGAALFLRGPSAPRALSACALALILSASVWQSLQMFPDTGLHLDRVAFGKRVQDLTEPDRKVVFVCRRAYRPGWYQHRTSEGEFLHHDCVDFYLSHRKGWSLGIDQVTPALLETLRQRGASYVCYFVADVRFAFNGRHPDVGRAFGPNCTPIEVAPHWGIYRLVPPASAPPTSTSEEASH